MNGLYPLILSTQDFLHPDISVATQSLIRIMAGILILGSLISMIPNWRRFFLSERWGGYGSSHPSFNLIQNPTVFPIIFGLWSLACLFLVASKFVVLSALVNLVFCHIFFIQIRWKSLTRGMGAPGFMAFWLSAAVLLLEYSSHYAPELRSPALLVLQIDFALIMLSAGVSKVTSGYLRNRGMEFGLANPMWGYWWKFYAKLPCNHWIFRVLNFLAWSLEILAGFLMLLPQTRLLGAALILLSFTFIATQIRLGLLCQIVMVCCFFFFHPGTLPSLAIESWVIPQDITRSDSLPSLFWVNALLGVFLGGYPVFRALALLGLWYNFYLKKRLPEILQKSLEKSSNFFGIILWRVFTADVTDFLVEIDRKLPSGKLERVSRYDDFWNLRYGHVVEAITVTTLFTTLKYFPDQPELFKEKLLRYAKTVPGASDLVFRYVAIEKSGGSFNYLAVVEYEVSPQRDRITEHLVDSAARVRSFQLSVPQVGSMRPGSYAPVRI